MSKVIAISNQKGGVGKTTSTINLAMAMAIEGKKVLCVDIDSQGNLSSTLYKDKSKRIPITLTHAINAYVEDQEFDIKEAVYHYESSIKSAETIDYLPANKGLAGLDAKIEKAYAREHILANIIEPIKDNYDYILVDCQPSLSIMTVNAFTFADSVLIPVQPEEYSINGLEDLIGTIIAVKKRINRKLGVEGILITMYDDRTVQHKGMVAHAKEEVGRLKLPVFKAMIPRSIRVSEAINKQKSIFEYVPNHAAATAYANAAKEVLSHE